MQDSGVKFFVFLYYYFKCIDNLKKWKCAEKLFAGLSALKKIIQFWNVETFTFSPDAVLMQLQDATQELYAKCCLRFCGSVSWAVPPIRALSVKPEERRQ